MAAIMNAPIGAETLARVLEPFGRSFTLPATAYTSEEVFKWEQQHFFEAGWMCVGRADDLPQPGDRRAVAVGSETVLLNRDDAGDLRAFYNVCRHRGHELVAPGEMGNARVIRCPYHAWVYGLDGALKGAPHYSDVSDFDRSEYPLVPVRIAEWHGWVFVNASGDAPSFDSHIANLEDFVAPYEPERLVRGARHDYVIGANWKIITENYHECYHCPQIHPELCKVSPPNSGINMDARGAWVGGNMDLMAHAATMSLTGESHGVVLRALNAEQRRQVFYFGLWPNLLLSLHPDYVMTHRIEPLAPGRSRVDCEWLFAPEAAYDGFDPSYASDFWDITNKQDWRACEAVQRGASSRGFRQGPLSPLEDAVYRFVTMVARGYLGDDIRARPSETPSLQSSAAS
jgi:Rieske 2Fe-2S family protein